MRKKLLSFVACLGVFAACSGDNRFTGPVGGGDERPEVVALAVSESVTRNGVLRVEVDAVSDEGITTLDILLEEGMVGDTTLSFDPPDLDLEAVAEFDVPATVTPGTSIVVTVTVTDDLGTVSDEMVAEVPVVEEEDGEVP